MSLPELPEWWPWILTCDFWGYVLDDSKADKDYGPEKWPAFLMMRFYWTYRFAGKFTRAWCRYRGHPAGVHWHSMGMEPDMHCKSCGEDLG